MDLKTFISETITNISNGIIEAQEINPQASINPNIYGIQEGLCLCSKNESIENATRVSFDISVTVQEKDSTDAKGQIKVAMFSLGGGISSEDINKATSRIKFDIPIIFPRKNPLKK